MRLSKVENKAEWILYCPACGEYTRMETEVSILLAPGSFQTKCPNCKANFEVSVQFFDKSTEIEYDG